MTYEEAMIHFKEQLEIFGGEHHEAMKVAIEALEKQIPKKVGEWDIHSYGTPYYCPECMSDITHVEFFRPDGSEPEKKVSYCWHCGQALDWGE